MKESLWIRIKAGIAKLFKNVWFNMLAVMITAVACLVAPAIGASLMFIYFVAWGFLADKGL